MRSDILRQLIEAHVDGDDQAFRKAALQLASAESTAGHTRVAEELREVLSRAPAHRATIVDIARPRGELGEVLEGGHRSERLSSIVLTQKNRELFERILLESRSRERLERYAVAPRRKLLFHGPPGCGKTLGACVLAGELGLPLMTVRLDALFSRFLGATANHLRSIFSEMPRRPGVYLFDEFDSIAKARGDGQDVGEMNRIVTAFLQLIDSDKSNSVLIAATNHLELLDRAIFRRFDLILPFAHPSAAQIESLIRLRFRAFDLPSSLIKELSRSVKGKSFADIDRACDDAIRSMALSGRDHLEVHDIEEAFEWTKRRSSRQR